MSNLVVKKVLSTRTYQAGYVLKKEVVGNGDEEYIITSAYTMSGGYIGDSKTAHFLCKKKGIKPERISPEHNVCSIGFCEKEQKWYGWSHRAIYGFGIGSTVTIGDCGFIPSNEQEFYDSVRNWYSDSMYRNVVCKKGYKGIIVTYDFTDYAGNITHESRFEEYPEKWGRGIWTAETLEDAKQMAIDYAMGVA